MSRSPTRVPRRSSTSWSGSLRCLVARRLRQSVHDVVRWGRGPDVLVGTDLDRRHHPVVLVLEDVAVEDPPACEVDESLSYHDTPVDELELPVLADHGLVVRVELRGLLGDVHDVLMAVSVDG